VIIEPGRDRDLPAVLAMREEASRWLAERGVDQWREPWPSQEAQEARILASLRARETWMVRDTDGATAATVALDEHADPRLWDPDDRQQPALYLHRLIVRRPWAGLGPRVLDWAARRAARLNKAWVRIDVWTHNYALHRYYLDHGFNHVRTLNLPDYPSGALFQRAADAVPSDIAPLVEREATPL
jgi:GNAT superfamily N-acetyltransferase